MNIQSLWTLTRTILIPTFLVITCPILVHFLAIFGHMNHINMTLTEMIFGNKTTLSISLIAISWAIFFLKIPSNQYYGPATNTGFKPRYQNNGLLYYLTTTLLFTTISFKCPEIPQTVYINIPYLIATLNTTALILAAVLWYKGKYYPEEKEKMQQLPVIFQFYRGLELHPRIFDIDVKQFTNCRVGMMGWQVLIISYWFSSYNYFGFNWGVAASVVLQSIYIFKFFWWETGYFNTIDIILDRAGFYICWGCLVFIPGLFVFPTYYFVANPPTISKSTAICLLTVGSVCILINYLIDHEKEIFRSSNGKRCLWSNKPRVVNAEYTTNEGKRKSKLLASGFWGTSRHLNYVFDLTCNYMWVLPGYNFGILPFVCVIFLTILFIHRLYRDDDKCSKKYGASWRQYCNLVRYKMIPYVY